MWDLDSLRCIGSDTILCRSQAMILFYGYSFFFCGIDFVMLWYDDHLCSTWAKIKRYGLVRREFDHQLNRA